MRSTDHQKRPRHSTLGVQQGGGIVAEPSKGEEEEGAWPRPHSNPGSARVEPTFHCGLSLSRHPGHYVVWAFSLG